MNTVKVSTSWRSGPPITRYPSRFILSIRMHFISTEYCSSSSNSNSGYGHKNNNNNHNHNNSSYHHLHNFYQDSNQQCVTTVEEHNNSTTLSLLKSCSDLSGLFLALFNSSITASLFLYFKHTFFQDKQQTLLSFFPLRVFVSLSELIVNCLTLSASVQPLSSLLKSPNLHPLSSSFPFLPRLLLPCHLRPHTAAAGISLTSLPRPSTLPSPLTSQTVSFLPRTPGTKTTASKTSTTKLTLRTIVVAIEQRLFQPLSAGNLAFFKPSHLLSDPVFISSPL